MRLSFFISVFCIGLLISACKKFEYSPYQLQTAEEGPGNLNALNIAKITAGAETHDDTVCIAFTGDSQRFYDRLESLVKKVNTFPAVDFLVMSGDIADFGILQEYIWIRERLEKLNVPFVCAVGNHDLAANNGKIYERIFGEKNFSFTYKKYKFVFHDTNGREYAFNGSVPNMSWLSSELKDASPEWFIGVSHVPPTNEDFDKKLEKPYSDLFAATPGFILSLHGHLHTKNDYYPYEDNVRYINSHAVEKSEFILLKFIEGKIIKQMVPY